MIKSYFNHIIDKILTSKIITNHYQIFYCFIIKVEIVDFYKSKLILILSYTTNKYNNIMKLANGLFLLFNIKLFFYISLNETTI